MTAIGATATAAVTITDNDLNATTSTDEEDGATAAANVLDGAAGDLGSFVTASGMDTAKAYLTAVAANVASAATVKFDKVDSVVDSEGVTDTETSDQLDVAILTLTAKVVTTPALPAGKHKHAVAISNAVTTAFTIQFDGTQELLLASPAVSVQANDALFIADIKSAANMTRATAFGVALDAHPGAFPTGKITFGNAASLTNEAYSLGANNAVVAFTVTGTDIVNLTIDSVLLSGTFAALAILGTNTSTDYVAGQNAATTKTQFRDLVAGAWYNTYGFTTNSGTTSLFTVTSATTDVLTIAGKSGSGRRGYNKGYSLSITSASTTVNSAVYGLSYGATTDPSDNNTISNGVVVTVEAATGGTLLDETSGLDFELNNVDAAVALSGGMQLLTTTLNLNSTPTVATTTATNIYPTDARGDVALPETVVAEIATAATTFNRVTWL
tara:strand:- start:3201 stop:4526 length:1326 start_codon:yes stop_codon:yes gene_type:complete